MPKVSFLRFPHQNSVRISLLYMWHTPPSRHMLLDLVYSTNRGAPQYVFFSILIFLLRCLPQHPVLLTPSAYVIPSVKDQVSHPYKQQVILWFFILLDSKRQGRWDLRSSGLFT